MEFRRSETLDEALSHLAELGDEAYVLAGGTDVMIQYLSGELLPGALVHIEPIDGMRGVSSDGPTTVGALTTHRELGTSSVIAARHPALAAAARTVGGWQTQAAGTIGGNICNASPAADCVPPLLVSEAELTLVSQSGERTVPVDEFIVGRRRTVRRPDELVTEMRLDPLPAGAGETYLKIGRRGAMEVALVGLAARISFDGASVTDARLGLASVATAPFRIPTAESALVAGGGDEPSLDAAAEALREAASPIDDPRATASYRLRTLRGLLARAVDLCREAAA